MGFIDSYKRLEKLCGDVLDDDRRVSAYIDEMLQIQNGARYVWGWDSDLRQLKHLRWVRNRIVHDPGCTEANMCEPGDTQWLDSFYNRMVAQTDPLALYYQAVHAQQERPLQVYSEPEFQNGGNSAWGTVAAALLVAAIAFAILLILSSNL